MGLLLWVIIILLNTAGTLEQRAQATGREAVIEVEPGLKVVSVYGARGHPTEDIQTVRVMVELAAGSLPLDVSHLILRYSDGTATASYVHAPEQGEGAFGAFWIRGSGRDATMLPGDLVEIGFPTPRPLAVRTSVSLALIPETGAPATADFKTPPTYGSDLVITLR